ncbi:hypothetical protein QVD17_30448 [Tagetes erecta]|uniref:Uncharacterized protein n=1 Tax=Tagetes erecta TaxID=13708 RepID=A0AAD8K3N7_TARER|nr:hypothetical protein QVD17_30448 [Tagetes erecta]
MVWYTSAKGQIQFWLIWTAELNEPQCCVALAISFALDKIIVYFDVIVDLVYFDVTVDLVHTQKFGCCRWKGKRSKRMYKNKASTTTPQPGNPGHKWAGNELIDSQFDIKFQKNVEKARIYELELDESKVKQFKEANENNYWFEFFIGYASVKHAFSLLCDLYIHMLCDLIIVGGGGYIQGSKCPAAS